MIHPKKILIYRKILDRILEEANEYAKEDKETGGYLFGLIHHDLVYEVTDLFEGGKKAERTCVSYSGNHQSATQKKEELQKSNPDIRLIGEWHLHPWEGSPIPSGADAEQLKETKLSTRPWFVIMLKTKEALGFWDLEEDGKTLIEVPYQVIPKSIDKKELMDRISKLVKQEELVSKTVLIIGLGSGGSVVAKYLSTTGIGRMILVDNEELEVANLIRHEGTVEDIGRPKVEILKSLIEGHNPFIRVETYQIDAVKEIDQLSGLIAQSDLVVASSGSPRINHIVNKICLDKGVQAVYGGAFEKAKGGYVLPVIPFKTPCFNCLFSITSKSYHVNKDAVRNYGMDEDELHAAQGLWVDISVPALLLAKIALKMLQGQTGFVEDYNLVLYKSSMEIQKLRFERRSDCAVCNFEAWVEELDAEDVEIDLSKIPKLKSEKDDSP